MVRQCARSFCRASPILACARCSASCGGRRRASCWLWATRTRARRGAAARSGWRSARGSGRSEARAVAARRSWAASASSCARWQAAVAAAAAAARASPRSTSGTCVWATAAAAKGSRRASCARLRPSPRTSPLGSPLLALARARRLPWLLLLLRLETLLLLQTLQKLQRLRPAWAAATGGRCRTGCTARRTRAWRRRGASTPAAAGASSERQTRTACASLRGWQAGRRRAWAARARRSRSDQQRHQRQHRQHRRHRQHRPRHHQLHRHQQRRCPRP